MLSISRRLNLQDYLQHLDRPRVYPPHHQFLQTLTRHIPKIVLTKRAASITDFLPWITNNNRKFSGQTTERLNSANIDKQ